MRRAKIMLGLALAACGGGGGSGDEAADAGGPFLAFTGNFQGFHGWSSQPATSTRPVASGVHTNGPMTVYLNQAPPKGSATFPRGTIIVKEVDVGDSISRQVFAMVKRGDGFNAGGAVDWEWFELQNQADGTELILWRGVGPPLGEKYGGDPNGCNGCHSAAKDNDFVMTDALRLSGM